MINNLSLVISDGTDPRRNLALESALMASVRENEMILYLWQNADTVVIGRNQNVRKECNLTNIRKDGVTIVRRPSGGGAVYHDLGNQNYTFLCATENYDVSRQTDVICRALAEAGIRAKISGRNDILVNGRKISGNAYYHHEGISYQHGTLLVCSDLSKMPAYLNPDPGKLKAKGVESVRSRVMNLAEIKPDLTPEMLRGLLVSACEAVYGLHAEERPQPDPEVFAEYLRMFASDEWTYGHEPGSGYTAEHRFSWGSVQLELQIRKNIIREAHIWSDAMEPDVIGKIPGMLRGCEFSGEKMAERLRQDTENAILCDIAEWLKEWE